MLTSVVTVCYNNARCCLGAGHRACRSEGEGGGGSGGARGGGAWTEKAAGKRNPRSHAAWAEQDTPIGPQRPALPPRVPCALEKALGASPVYRLRPPHSPTTCVPPLRQRVMGVMPRTPSSPAQLCKWSVPSPPCSGFQPQSKGQDPSSFVLLNPSLPPKNRSWDFVQRLRGATPATA